MVFKTLIFISFPLVMASHFAPVVPQSPLSVIGHASSPSETVRTVLAASHDDLAAWAVSVRACSDDACIALAVSKPIAGADIGSIVRTEKAKISGFKVPVEGSEFGGRGPVGQIGGGAPVHRPGMGTLNGTAEGDSIKGKNGCETVPKDTGGGKDSLASTLIDKNNIAQKRNIVETGRYHCQCGRTCRHWNKNGGMAFC